MTPLQLLDEFTALPDEAQHQVADFVAFLRQKYKPVSSTPLPHLAEMKDESFIGMWRDQPETSDSTAWVRQRRKAEWGQSS